MQTSTSDNPLCQFIDLKGHTWNVAINVATLMRVKAGAGVDLLSIFDREGALAVRLLDDPVFLFNILWPAVKSEAEARGVSAEDFADGLGGDVLQGATEALFEAIGILTRSEAKQEMLRGLVQAVKHAEECAAAKVQEQAERFTQGNQTPEGGSTGSASHS